MSKKSVIMDMFLLAIRKKEDILKTAIAKRMTALLLLVVMAVPFIFGDYHASAKTEQMKGVWVATVYSINFPSVKNNVAAQKAELDKIVENAYNAGLNAIFFQVRPQGDALYRSSIYPWSEVLTGTAGKDPGYDPLEYLINAAKKKNIGVHAWINPYRLTTGSVTNPKNTIDSLPAGHPVRDNPSMAVSFDDGKLYLDPGNPDARQLVLDGVKEIIENYDVAGVHFDDYFYPSPNVTVNGSTYKAEFNDAESYAKYGAGMTLEDWRRNNTYTLVKETYELVNSYNKNLMFGVSPSGIWDNKKDNPLGSDTNGFSSYSQIYADSRKWVKDGIVDYICPQIYWNIGATNSDYKTIANWWNDVCKGTGVDLYIGHAAYRVEDFGSADEIIKQLELNKTLSEVKGSIYYGYAQIADNTLSLKDKLAAHYGKQSDISYNEFKQNVNSAASAAVNAGNALAGKIDTSVKPPVTDDSLAKPVSELVIGAPNNNYSTSSSKSYIIGAGVKGVPIYVNGKEIERTESGYFALYVDLNVGKNVFTFEHNGKTVNYIINRSSGYATNLNVNGEYEDDYDSSAGSAANTYAMIENLSSRSIIGTIISDEAVMRVSNSSSATRKTPMVKGIQDYIVNESTSYYKFRYGGWTLKSNVSISEGTLPDNVITKVSGTRTDDATTIRWNMPVGAMHTITEMVEGIEIRFHNTQGAAAFTMASSNPMFKSITYKQDGTDAVYTLYTKKERYLFGYEVRYTGGVLEIEFNHPLGIQSGSKPLTGKVIHLDSGHGGSDPGATGPLGAEGPREADLNMYAMLQLKERLEALGATIVTSNTDVNKTTSQTEREQSVKSSGADIGISIHHNSVDTSVNVSNVKGTETLYSQPLSRRLADTIQKNLVSNVNTSDRGIKYQSLYMCRFREMPTVLIELGFITNPYEYESLASRAYIDKEIDGIVDGIVEYMSY